MRDPAPSVPSGGRRPFIERAMKAGMRVDDACGGQACVVGRDAEFRVLAEFLGPDPGCPVLVVTGGQGIGKTTLWEAGLRLARERGFRVLAARPSEAEARHSFAALFDLMEGIGDETLDTLPVPQRQALKAAVLRSPPPVAVPEPFAIAAGYLNALRALAATTPLLLAVDDLQCLDAASADVLAFAARRLHGPRSRFMFARRSGSPANLEQALGPAGVTRVEMGPLTPGGVHDLLSRRLKLTVPRRTLGQLYDATHGNPLLVLELGRALAAGEGLGRDPFAGLAANPFERRVAALAEPARRALFATALSGHPSLRLLEAVAGPAAVADLTAAGLLAVDGDRVRPSHPLLTAAVSRHSTAAERRALHRDLAAAADDQTLRARHLALAAAGTDDALAAVAAAAAAAALRRGATYDAIDLAEHALRLTPRSAAGFPDRLLALAECLVIAGEPPRARELLEPRMAELPAGAARARAHLLLGEAGDLAEHEYHLARALAESQGEPGLAATALATGSILLSCVRAERIPQAQACAERALTLARVAGTPVQRHASQALAWARVLRGLPVDDLSDHAPGPPEHASLYASSLDRPAAVRLAFRGQVAQARGVFRRLAALAEERGEGRFLAVLQVQQCELELRAGDVAECGRLLDRWDERVSMEDTAAMRARCLTMLAAIKGAPEETERRAAEAMVLLAASASQPAGPDWDQLEVRRALGMAALLARRPEQAASALGSIWEHARREGVDDPGAFPVAPDLVEALLQLGRQAEAVAVTGRLRELAERQRHPWGLATADRCAAAVALTSRYDEAGLAALAAAADTLGGLGLGFDRARSLLWLGQAARRARKRAEARRFLDAAGAAFDDLGAVGWAARAREELTRLGAQKAAGTGKLTAAEQRVAALAADGLSNKEIARRLFIAVHTVEVHLAHAYAKLGVRSRAQLASQLTRLAASPVGD